MDPLDPSAPLTYADEHHCIASIGRCIITYSTRPPDARYFQAWDAIAARVMQRHPGKLAVVTIIHSDSPTPDEPQRKLIRSAMLRHADSVELFAYVVEGRGFAAAALRSAIALTNLTVRTPYRQKVFGSVEEAGAWLAHGDRDAGASIDPGELAPLAQTMRQRIKGLAHSP